MHYLPSEDAEHIGTSSLLATWNAATYVAQIDELAPREGDAASPGKMPSAA